MEAEVRPGLNEECRGCEESETEGCLLLRILSLKGKRTMVAVGE